MQQTKQPVQSKRRKRPFDSRPDPTLAQGRSLDSRADVTLARGTRMGGGFERLTRRALRCERLGSRKRLPRHGDHRADQIRRREVRHQRQRAIDGITPLHLGEWWNVHTGGLPLPLGGNVIRRDLGDRVVSQVSRILHDSIKYALDHRDEALDYALTFGRGLDRTKADRFVGMYVNELTLSYGTRGKQAVQRLFDEAFGTGLPRRPITAEYAA